MTGPARGEAAIGRVGRTAWPIWLAAGAFVLALHASGLVLALGAAVPDESDDLGASALEIGLEMAAPRREPSDLPPGPEAEEAAAAQAMVQQQATETPTELPKAVPTEAEDPDRIVSPDATRKPQEDKPEVKRTETSASQDSVASEAAAVPTSETMREAPRSTAPVLGTGESARRARVTWQKQLLAHLDRHKRYPSGAAQATGQVTVTFVLDRLGRVASASVSAGSGDAALDRAALAMMQRADPVPPPPPLVADEGLTFAIPVVFRAKKGK
ncbi:TonB family protein [Methylobacterium sp. 4-46]|uniref:TonB family protein n=1 Tax=unclassified Methylobacterium TaxID=2615210 RepID=UPI000165C817|nr:MULTISPECIES: TonB family protein [Methylobacterium]ACA15660.1 TonB family protein [Methylobacterium sp. 4-46]WFT81372.1 TonB family protein [Methylobacterium nodulans]WFT81420.1 TonB family protein [Methylobacterium nodulans]